MKTYLKSYELVTGGFLTSGGSPYWLTVLEVSWFGLVKRKKKISIEVPCEANYVKTIENWDNLIKTQKPLK